MAYRQHCKNTLRPEMSGLALRPILSAGKKSDVHLELADSGYVLLGVAFDELYFNFGVAFVVGTDQFGQESRCDRREYSYPQPPILRTPDITQIFDALPNEPKHSACLRQKSFSRKRESNAKIMTVE